MEKKEKIRSVILPGSYDPVTLGHLDIIRRASEKFDEVYAVVFINPDKNYTFTLDERVKMLMLATDEYDNVLVSYSNGLVIDYMREHDIELIIKGYRNQKDMDYELTQAAWNKKHGGYETELWQASEELVDISSTLARENLKDEEELKKILPASVVSFIKNR